MLLSYNDLISKVVRQKVLAHRFSEGEDLVEINFNQVNSASIDILLGPTIMVETVRPDCSLVVDYRLREPLSAKKVQLDRNDGYVLGPQDFILAQSMEIFHLPNNLSCEYKLKSSMARIGLEHLNAGWCDAGWHGSVLTLELVNISRYHSIRIRPGDPIGQMVFYEHEPVPENRSYATRGRYNKDTVVTGIKK
jgi:dCTP deaminase